MRHRAALAAVFLPVLAILGAGAAHAEELPVAISFNEPRTKTVEYGQVWDFAFIGDDIVAFEYDLDKHPGNEAIFQVKTTGTPSGYAPAAYAYVAGGGTTGSVFHDYGTPLLGVGSYTFSVAVDGIGFGNTYKGETPQPASLTITPAALGTEVRVVPDEADPRNAIVTARFTGRFVDEYQSSYFPGAAISPAGQWSITVVDAAGDVAVERSVDREAGDDTLATSFYWSGAKPGEQYTATATFTPSGTSGANFAATPAAAFEFTADESQRVVAASDAIEKPAADLPPEPDLSVPLWLVLLIGLASAALITVAVIFGVRLLRSRAPIAAEELS